MRKKLTLLALCCGLLPAGTAMATTYTFQPTPDNLWNLNHSHAYDWGMTLDLANGEILQTATLLFDDIHNWRTEENRLFISLLDKPTNSNGVTVFTDNQADFSNYFTGNDTTLLHTYQNLPKAKQDLSLSFDATELLTLAGYLQNDNHFGIGIDPDCHFKNDGIRLTLTTQDATNPVPEPATLLLLGTGLGLAGLYSRRRK